MQDEGKILIEAVADWRAEQAKKIPLSEKKSPYGAKIADENARWGKVRAAHDALLADEKRKYEERIAQLQKLHQAWLDENSVPKVIKKQVGRPTQEYSVEVKKAAARALAAGISKTAIRGILGTGNTRKLNACLADGQALLDEEGQGGW